MPVAGPANYRLQRKPTNARGLTVGAVTLDGQHVCVTGEDTIREVSGQPVASWKVAGQTAIPSGRYRVIVTPSERFQRMLPILLDVSGFTGIRIHPGNRAEDTEGCILPGLFEESGLILQSKSACAVWQAKIEEYLLRGREVWIDVVNP